MTSQNKATIKSYFETGDKPTQAQFANLIDSYVDTSAGTMNQGTIVSAAITGSNIAGGTIVSADGSLINLTVSSSASVPTPTTNTFAGNAANMASVQNSMLGGYINKFRNPGMDIWQRGTSGTITAGSPAYTADGWIVGCVGANNTWGQSNSPGLVGSSVYGAGSRYSLNVTGATSTSDTFIKQRIESFLAYQLYGAGNTAVTVMCNIFNNTGAAITPTLTVKHANSVDNFGALTTDINAVSLQSCANNAWNQVAYTFTPASGTVNGLEVIFDFDSTINSGTKSINIGMCDIRLTPGVTPGLNSNPPLTELRPIGPELSFCQRYLPAFISTSTLDSLSGGGIGASTTTAVMPVFLPVQTRIAPTGIVVDASNHITITDSVTGTVSTAVAGIQYGTKCCFLLITVASGLTQYRPYSAYFNSASGYLIFTGAEL